MEIRENCLAKQNGAVQTKSTRKHSIFNLAIAGAHYSKKAVQYLNDQNIKFAPNPPNISDIRCLEGFLGLFKGEAYKDGWEAENWDQLRTRIFKIVLK